MSVPPFIDAVHAAELLRVPVEQVVDWVTDGRLTGFGGRPGNPFLRSAQVAALAEELGVRAEEAPRRTRSASARVQQRLTADARWADLSDGDLEDWVRRADPVKRAAAVKVVHEAQERLERLLALLDAEQRASDR